MNSQFSKLALALGLLSVCAMTVPVSAQTNEELQSGRPSGTDRSLSGTNANTTTTDSSSSKSSSSNSSSSSSKSGSSSSSSGNSGSSNSSNKSTANPNNGPQVLPRVPVMSNPPINSRVPIKPRP